MPGRKKLTPEQREANRKEKAERLKLKGKAMIAKAKQIESKEKQRERKERTHELIEIGAIFCQFHDRKKLLEYLKKPKYVVKGAEKMSVVEQASERNNTTIFLPPLDLK
jgi:predicted aconitase